MSAIYGIINKKGKPVDRELLQQVKNRIIHRAQAGAAEWCDENAGFGFCRSIHYPHQEQEQLPLEEDGLVITANARLFNREALIHELGLDTIQHACTPDSYLLLAAYKKWKALCVHHLDGEFVFAVWETASRKLFIATDHIGYKPLYYYDDDEQFIFCSELKGIEAVKRTPNHFDAQSLEEFFFFSGKPDATYNRDIKYLCAATTLSLHDRVVLSKYWKLGAAGTYRFKNSAQWAECLQDLFVKAVSKRMIAGKPVGITLSGGLDSGSIACILSQVLKQKNQPLYTFSTAYEQPPAEQKADDHYYIRILQAHCDNIIPGYVDAANVDVFGNIGKAVDLDEVIPNFFYYMDLAILEKARDTGIGMLFSGFGGDYWVSAPGRKVIYNFAMRLQWGKAYGLIKQLAEKRNRKVRDVFFTEVISHTPPARLYRHIKYGQFERMIRLPQRGWWNDGDDSLAAMPGLVNEGKIGRQAALFENRNAFFNTGAATPFFDRSLMEFMIHVPPELFLESGYKRHLFREAMKGILPEEIRLRTTKHPYVPDYLQRISKNRGIIKTLSQHPGYAVMTGRYLEGSRLENYLANVLGDETQAGNTKMNAINAARLVCSILAADYLVEKKYIFDA